MFDSCWFYFVCGKSTVCGYAFIVYVIFVQYLPYYLSNKKNKSQNKSKKKKTKKKKKRKLKLRFSINKMS